MPSPPVIQVEGSKELRRLIKQADSDLAKTIRLAHNRIVAPIENEAIKDAPKRSGKLSKSIRPGSTQKEARLRIGSAKKVPYAGPITYGWPKRGIRPNPYLANAIKERMGEVRDVYETEITEMLRDAIESTGD